MFILIIIFVVLVGAAGYFIYKNKSKVSKKNKNTLDDYIKSDYNVNKNKMFDENDKLDSTVSNKIDIIKDSIRAPEALYKTVVAHLMFHQNIDAYIRHFVVNGEKHDTDAIYDSVKHIVKEKLTKDHEIFKLFRTAFETEFNQKFTPLFEDIVRLFLPTNVSLSFEFLSLLTKVFSDLLVAGTDEEAVVSLIQMTLITHIYPRYNHRNMNLFVADTESLAEEWVEDQGAVMNPDALSVFIKLVKKHSKYVVDQDAFKQFTNGQITIRPRMQRGSSEPEPAPTGTIPL